jgi:subtilase-type serine protease
MIGFNHGNLAMHERYSHAKVDSYVLGAYGSHQFNALRGSYGASYSWHTISAQRDTGPLGITKSRHPAATAQAFTEIGLPSQFGRTNIEPYMGLAYIQTRRDAFTESGAAGLQAQEAKQRIGLSTVGIRASSHWTPTAGSQLKLYGGTGWQRVYGKLQSSGRMQFCQGDHFEINGTPLARYALLLEAGISLSLRRMQVEAAYTSQLAHGAKSHAIKANLSWWF